MPHSVMLVTTDLVHDSRVRKEAETLAENGYRVTVFSHIRRDDVPKLGWERWPALTAVPVPQPVWQSRRGPFRALPHSIDLLRWGGSRALLQAAAGCRGDTYHAHDLDTLPSAAELARRNHAGLIFDAHELFVEMMYIPEVFAAATLPSQIKQRVTRANYTRLEHSGILGANAVITVSGAIADELARRHGVRRPALVLNAPRYRDMSGGSEYLRQRLGLGPEQRIVLFQGGVFPHHNLRELIGSLSLLSDLFVLVFLGFNLGTSQETVRQEVAQRGLQARVHLLDALPPEQLLTATASADIGIIPLVGHNLNMRWAMPNKLFEYLMAGLPFIAPDLPEIGRVAKETGAGLVISELTPESFAGAIRQVLEDSERRQEMRLACLTAARTEYNWERQTGRLLEVYRQLPRPSAARITD